MFTSQVSNNDTALFVMQQVACKKGWARCAHHKKPSHGQHFVCIVFFPDRAFSCKSLVIMCVTLLTWTPPWPLQWSALSPYHSTSSTSASLPALRCWSLLLYPPQPPPIPQSTPLWVSVTTPAWAQASPLQLSHLPCHLPEPEPLPPLPFKCIPF